MLTFFELPLGVLSLRDPAVVQKEGGAGTKRPSHGTKTAACLV